MNLEKERVFRIGMQINSQHFAQKIQPRLIEITLLLNSNNLNN